MSEPQPIQPPRIEAIGAVHPHTLGLEALNIADCYNYDTEALAEIRQNYETAHGIAVDRLNPDHSRRHGKFAVIGEADAETKRRTKEAYIDAEEWYGSEAGVTAIEQAEAIDTIRQFLAGLDGRGRQIINDEIEWVLPDRTLKRAKKVLEARNAKGIEVDLIDWLTNKQSEVLITSGAPSEVVQEARVSEDARILTFLRAHKNKLAVRQARPEFTRAVQIEKDYWSSSIHYLTDESWFHPSAHDRADEIKDLKVYEGDKFSTNLKGFVGYLDHKFTNKSVVLARDRLEVVEHEFNHAQLEVFPTNPKAEFNYTWLVEALTEEIAMAVKGVFDPGESSLREGGYPGMRGLLRDFIGVAQQLGADVTFRDFTYAYSAPEVEQTILTKEINRRLSEVIPHNHPNIIQVVHKFYLTALARVKTKNPDMLPMGQMDLAARAARLDVRAWLDTPSQSEAEDSSATSLQLVS